MKKIYSINESLSKDITLFEIFRTLLLILGIQLGSSYLAKSQELNYTRPSWLIGVAAGANFNFHEGTTQELNSNFNQQPLSIWLRMAMMQKWEHVHSVAPYRLKLKISYQNLSYQVS